MSVNMKTLESLGLTEKPKSAPDTKSNQLGQDTFLKLMMTQLEKQNPLNPQDSSEFLSQLAQFTMVTGIQELKESFSTVATSMSEGQAMQAANLIGKKVAVASDKGVLGVTGGITGSLELPTDATSLKVEIVNAGGATVRTLDLGASKKGEVPFKWDGLLDDKATPANPGPYTLKVEAVMEGKTVALQPRILASVESVTLGGAQGMEVDLGVLGRRRLADILEVVN